MHFLFFSYVGLSGLQFMGFSCHSTLHNALPKACFGEEDLEMSQEMNC